MKLVLDVATILGGIAASWFVAQQLLAIRKPRDVIARKAAFELPTDRQETDSRRAGSERVFRSQRCPRETRRTTTPMSHLFVSAFVLLISGVLAGLGFFIFSLTPAVGLCVLGVFYLYGIGVLVQKTRYESIAGPFYLAAVAMMLWCVLAFGSSVVLHLSNGGSFPIAVSPFQNTSAGIILIVVDAMLGFAIGAWLRTTE
jgi:hypothetical protein